MTGEPPQYLAAHIQQRLAEDPRTAEQGVRAFVRDRQVFLRGAVPSQQRRDRVLTVVREMMPDHQVHDELELTDCAEPVGREEL
jgi:osmotically-inducible protein OsmY